MPFTPSPEALALLVPGVSRAPAAMFAVHELFTQALADEDVDVYLGPYHSGDPDDAVFVGYDGDPDGDMEAIVHTSRWAGTLGQKRRDEEFNIRCCILNLSGAGDAQAVPRALTRIYGYFGTMAALLHANPALGLGIHPFTAEITGPSSYLPPAGDIGVEGRVTFDVHVTTRI